VTHHLGNVVLSTERDDEGQLTAISTARRWPQREVFIYAEIDRVADSELPQLRDRLETALADVRTAVSDFPAMKARLREVGGPFGGELAGHFYFRDFAYADSAFLTMITVMNIIDTSGKSLSELIRPFKTYVTSGEINFRTEAADVLLAEAAERFPGGRLLTIDGVRLDFDDWWFSLRKSNTEPLLRLVVEGDTRPIMEARASAIKDWIMEHGAELE